MSAADSPRSVLTVLCTSSMLSLVHVLREQDTANFSFALLLQNFTKLCLALFAHLLPRLPCFLITSTAQQPCASFPPALSQRRPRPCHTPATALPQSCHSPDPVLPHSFLIFCPLPQPCPHPTPFATSFPNCFKVQPQLL